MDFRPAKIINNLLKDHKILICKVIFQWNLSDYFFFVEYNEIPWILLWFLKCFIFWKWAQFMSVNRHDLLKKWCYPADAYVVSYPTRKKNLEWYLNPIDKECQQSHSIHPFFLVKQRLSLASLRYNYGVRYVDIHNYPKIWHACIIKVVLGCRPLYWNLGSTTVKKGSTSILGIWLKLGQS